MEILSYWPWLLLAAEIVIVLIAALHILLYMSDSRSALAWMAILWLAPFLGAFLYLIFGINRIQRRARRLKRRPRKPEPLAGPTGDLPEAEIPALPAEASHLAALSHLTETVTEKPLLAGNAVLPLRNGDEAYPMMLKAIDEAKHSVGVLMYIFNHDATGLMFVEALGRAVARGVTVRVLVDDIGAHFTWRSIVGPLSRANVPNARFLPRWIPRFFAYANLRNHCKIMTIDGRLAFTGGLNITDECWLAHQPPHPVHDLHFRIEGPIVAQIQEVLADDWKFTTGESLHDKHWFPVLTACGPTQARGVRSGPDQDLEKIRLVRLGALASADSSVRIVTPYFLPDGGLISALNIAALRGIKVDILLPKNCDLRFVQWACMAQLSAVLDHGCRVWLVPPPFRHTKLMIVDGVWTLLGSANWDPRSLRLNFEFDVECYDRSLAAELENDIIKDLARAERLTSTKLHRRSFPAKIRDGMARLLTPLL